jgi:hypothetical protein
MSIWLNIATRDNYGIGNVTHAGKTMGTYRIGVERALSGQEFLLLNPFVQPRLTYSKPAAKQNPTIAMLTATVS